jgi:hypothetical protein
MEFQVVTDKRMPKLRAGRSIISFFFRKDMKPVADAIIDQKTDTGRMRASSPELTALDLLRYSHAIGTIDSIATALSDLGAKIQPERLAELAPAFERTATQRLGFLLDHLKFSDQAKALHERLAQLKALPWIELEPKRGSNPAFYSPPLERNTRWHVVVRHLPEIDE